MECCLIAVSPNEASSDDEVLSFLLVFPFLKPFEFIAVFVVIFFAAQLREMKGYVKCQQTIEQTPISGNLLNIQECSHYDDDNKQQHYH